MFKKAVKYGAKLRLAIAGPSGSGKTYTALAIASHLGDRIAVVDTEHGSASKYASEFDFDVLELDAPFHPARYVEAIKEAAAAGYDVVILDSLSHAWNGTGGLLEIVDEFAKRQKTANSFTAWKDATPIQNNLIENIVGARLHLIATMRSKQEYVLEQVERNGRTISQPKKVGMAPIQRDSMEYEFDVYIDMTIENDGIIQKTRCSALTGRVFNKPGADVATILKEWLSGEPAPEKPKAQVQEPSTNGHKTTKQARPLSAEAVKEAMQKKTTGKGDKAPSDKQRAYALSSLSAVSTSDEHRHTITLYLFDKASANDLTAAECSALIDWIDYKEVAPDDWQATPDAIQEAANIIRQDALDKGQQELFPAAA